MKKLKEYKRIIEEGILEKWFDSMFKRVSSAKLEIQMKSLIKNLSKTDPEQAKVVKDFQDALNNLEKVAKK